MKPIPVPATLILSDQVWTVEQHATRRSFRAAMAVARIRGARLQGFCVYDHHTIHLAPHRDARALGRTYLHELLHACGARREDRGGLDEERFVSEIEDPLATVIEGMLSAAQEA